VVLGIDEYTACVVDLGEGECSVMGAGGVTLRKGGLEARFEAGSRFGLDELRSAAGARRSEARPKAKEPPAEDVVEQARDTLAQRASRAQAGLPAAAGEHPDTAAAGEVYDLAQALEQARRAGVEDNVVSEARASLSRLLVAWSDRLASSPAESVADIGPFVQLLVDVRSELRAARNWAAADSIRDRLSALGIVLEDGPDGTTWRRHEDE
jgi:cysteinyl-tRNA synthetase